MSANERQVAGSHYKNAVQHWDWVAANDLDYFQGQITKYVARWKNKNGLEDLRKAQHFLEKYIEISEISEIEGARVVADVSVNVSGVSSVGDVNTENRTLARWQVLANNEVVSDYSTEKAAKDACAELNRTHEGSPYSWVDSEIGAPTSAYVNQ